MGVAAGVAAAAAAASAANGIANSGGGSTSSYAGPVEPKYLGGGQSAALNELQGRYLTQELPDLSSGTYHALGGLWDASDNNAGYLTGAQGAAGNFANGAYYGSNPAYGYLGNFAAGGATNPYLDRTFDLAAGKVRNALDSQFAQAGGNAGMYGSPQQQAAMASNLNDLATNIYGSQYNNDQNRALSAAGALGNIAQSERQQQIAGAALQPGLATAQIAGPSSLLSGNQYLDQYHQQEYWKPFDALQRYMNIVNANNGQITQTPYYTNPAGQALGYGLLANQLMGGSGGGRGLSWTNTGGGTLGGTINGWLGTNGMGGVADPNYLSTMNSGLTSYGGGF